MSRCNVQEQREAIIERLIKGQTVKEIAAGIGIPRRTVTERINQMKKESQSANITEHVCKIILANSKKYSHIFQTPTVNLGCP